MRRRLPYGHSVIRTPEALAEMVSAYRAFDAFAFDVETTPGRQPRFDKDKPALDPRTNKVFWISLAGPGRADVIPIGHKLGELISPMRKEKEAWYDEANPTKTGKPRKKWRTVTIDAVYDEPPAQLRPGDVFAALHPLFFSDITKVAHNAKFDLASIRKYYGKDVPGPFADTLIAQHLVDERVAQKGLKELSKRHLGLVYEDLGKVVDNVAFSSAARYARLDARATWLLWRHLHARLRSGKLEGAFALDMDTLAVLLRAEHEGAEVDLAALRKLDQELSAELEELKGELYRAAGGAWDVNSQVKQGWFVYEVCGHAPKRITKSGRAGVAASDLEAYASKDKRVATMVRLNEVRKLHSTYVVAIGDRLAGARLHANFTLHVARTGRLSCTEPNLQNIPRPGSAYSSAIRGMFVPPRGHKLIVADYSQIEYRVLAHLSRDREYMRIFTESDEDPHVSTASMLFDLAPEEVTSEQRTVAKNTGFAVVYGAGADKVADMSRVSLKRAKEVMDKHRRQFPGIYAWIDQTVRDARRQGGVRTLLGRRRRLPELNAMDRGVRGAAERQAVNTRVQGSAADIIKLAMVRLDDMLPEHSRLILSIHDEIVTTVPTEHAEEVAAIVEEAMTGPGIQDLLRVPLKTDAKIVSAWGDAK